MKRATINAETAEHAGDPKHETRVPTVELELASADDAEAVAALRTAVAVHLTRAYGRGYWSAAVTVKGVLNRMRLGRVFVARDGTRVVGTLCLTTRRPWAIDPAYFSPVRRSIYLIDMAVSPHVQRTGIGRRCLAEAERLGRSWPADAIRLDAYDHPSGAGGFYERCGFREAGRVVYRTVPLIYFERLLTARVTG